MGGLAIPLMLPASVAGARLSHDAKARCSHWMALAQHGTTLQANGLFTERPLEK